MFDVLGWIFLGDPSLAAAWGTWLAVVLAAIAFHETLRTRMRGAVTEALRDVMGPEIEAARDRLGVMAASGRRVKSASDVAEARRDIFKVMWAVERLSLVRASAKTSLATQEMLALYAHAQTMIKTSNEVRVLLDLGEVFDESAARANKVLDSLPDARSRWRKVARSAPSRRFE